MLRDADSIAAAVLRWQLGLHGGATLSAVCDALVAEVLRMPPGPLSLDRIRTHVLARRAGIEAKGDPVKLAARVAASAMGVRRADQRSMTQALGRRWLDEDFDPPPELPPAHPAGPPDDDVVLALVREAIPRIGAGGRYGTEKVFVSAIWDRIEGDRRAGGLSLDRFKRWLVTANREGWLVLARADLVSAMDRELVAASEIEDRGATFHFVLDRRDGGQEAGWDHHAP
jgi:hypothetical protein